MQRNHQRNAKGGILTRIVCGSLAILVVGITASISTAAQGDLDALRRRLAEVEAQQEKSQKTIEALHSEIEALDATAAQGDLDALRRRLAEVEAQQAKSQTTIEALRSEIEAGGTEDESLADKLAGEAHPGPLGPRSVFPELADESRFILRSEDDDFEFGIDGLLILRAEFNHREDDGSGSSDNDSGFEMIGTRINFKGRVYQDYGYWVRLQADEFGKDPFIDAALGYYRINDDATVVLGQFPSILTRDQGIPVDKLQVGESSPTNYTFDPFGFLGAMAGYHTPRLVFRGIFHDGYRSLSNSSFDRASADWAFAGQVVGMVVGDEDDWPRFNNFTSRPGSDFAWQLNGAFTTQQGGTGQTDWLSLAIFESSMEGNGWNLYGEFFYRYTDEASDGTRADDFGFVVQGGAWVAKHFEVYSRFDMTIPDRDRPTEDGDFKTITAGINFYPIPRTDNIKFLLEGLYMFDDEAGSIVEPNTFSSVRESPDGDQWVLRAQAQIRW